MFMVSEQKSAVQADPLSGEYMNGLYGYALALTRNHAEAEDLVQETYVRAIAALKRLRSDSNVKAWLFKILRNIWLNELRKKRSASTLGQPDSQPFSVDHLVSPGKDSYE